MKKKITKLSVGQTGKFMAVFYALLAVLMLPFMLIGILSDPNSPKVVIFMLILYPLMGFIGGLIMAGFYNLTSKWVGGIEVIVENSDEEIYSEPGV